MGKDNGQLELFLQAVVDEESAHKQEHFTPPSEPECDNAKKLYEFSKVGNRG